MSVALRKAEQLHASGKLKEAVQYYREAIDSEPNNPEVWYGLGVASLAMRDYRLAIKFFEAAKLGGASSVSLEYNLGIANDALGNYTSAELHYREALAIDPSSILPNVTLGGMLYRRGRPLEAYAEHSKAIAKPNPSHEEMAARASIFLLRQQWRQGWREYEARLTIPEFIAQHPGPSFGRPWRGQKLSPKRRLLLWHEQGHGDTIQMLRYIPRIAELGSPITLAVQPLLKKLVEGQGYPVEYVVESGEGHPVNYYHCPLMSIPWALRDQGGLEPFWGGAYIKPVPTEIPELPPTDKLRVGIQWTSDSQHQNAKDRNCPFKYIVPLLRTKGVEWVSVQTPRPANTLERVNGLEILETEIKDFADTASVLSQLDLFIAIDSAAGHLAGAMGVPVWLLVPSAPEFRWGLEVRENGWYPGHTIYRRISSSDWPELIVRVKSDLQAEVTKRVG